MSERFSQRFFCLVRLCGITFRFGVLVIGTVRSTAQVQGTTSLGRQGVDGFPRREERVEGGEEAPVAGDHLGKHVELLVGVQAVVELGFLHARFHGLVK